MKYYFFLAFIVYSLSQQSRLCDAQDRVRYVSYTSGTDAGNCTQGTPCQTIDYALFENFKSYRDYFNCTESPEFADNSLIMVEDGYYTMEGFGLVLCEVFNVTIKAVNPRKVIVQCGCYNCSIENAMFGNIYVQNSRNISFDGLIFERCGYNASNVFVRTTDGLTFKDCTFR